jgi:hypothetical protein
VLKVLQWEHKVLKERQVLRVIKVLKVPFKVHKVFREP